MLYLSGHAFSELLPASPYLPFSPALTRVLQELMTPVECLMPAETMSQNHEGKRIIYELETAIVNAKKLFLDTQVTKAIVDLMSSVLQVCICLCMFCTCLYLLYCL